MKVPPSFITNSVAPTQVPLDSSKAATISFSVAETPFSATCPTKVPPMGFGLKEKSSGYDKFELPIMV